MSVKASGKTDNLLLSFMEENATITIPELAEKIGVASRSIERRITREGLTGRVKGWKGSRGVGITR